MWAQNSTRYRTAIIGAGWWGNNILRCAMEAGQSKIVGISDVDERALVSTASEVAKLTGDQPKHYRDYREMLAKEKPEICIVATPDHWHALPVIAALKAGAHVYVEKPISHTLREGSAMLKTARDTQRLVQVGTHRRIRFEDLQTYKRAMHASQSAALERMAENARELGLEY